MRKLLAGSFALGLMAVGMSPALAKSDNSNTKLDLINDCGPNAGAGNQCPGARDMLGPVAGFVNYSQQNDGDLRLVIAVKDGLPDTDYVLTVYCGPTHTNAQAIIETGDVYRTNGQGNANNGAKFVPAAALAVCGPGTHTGHIDLDFDQFSANGSTLAATPIVFTVP